MSDIKAIKIGSNKIIVNNIESYLYNEKLDYTEILMCSGAVHLGVGNITKTIEQLLSISICHEYKEFSTKTLPNDE
jgi:hypothetical protein